MSLVLDDYIVEYLATFKYNTRYGKNLAQSETIVRAIEQVGVEYVMTHLPSQEKINARVLEICDFERKKALVHSGKFH